MLNIIKYAESKQGIAFRPIDVKEKCFCAFITSKFLPWLFLIFVLNKKNWRRPVILVLIGHYIFRAIGSFLQYWIEIRPKANNTIWPYTFSNWYFFYAPGNVLFLLGEIIGDWYPLIRTKAVTMNKKNIRIVTVTCILYNLVKVYGMICYFLDFPIDLRHYDENHKEVNGTVTFKIKWWGTVAAIQVACFFYDLSVIYALKNGLFDKIKDINKYNKNSFLDKFKQISEFRIILSIIASLLFLPFIVMFVFSLYEEYKHGKNPAKRNIETQIEQLRQTVLSVNYSFMYIDQILLIRFAERSKKQGTTTNTGMGKAYNPNNEKVIQNRNHRNIYKKEDSFQNLSGIPEKEYYDKSYEFTEDSQITLNNNNRSNINKKPNISYMTNNDSPYYINSNSIEECRITNSDKDSLLANDSEQYCNIDMSNIETIEEHNHQENQFQYEYPKPSKIDFDDLI